MTPTDFQVLMDELSPLCGVSASETIEDAFDIDLDDEWVSLQWNDASQQIALTVPVTLVFNDPDSDATRLALYRLLLVRQWTQLDNEEGVSFGLLPELNEVVGMTTLGGEDIASPHALLQALHLARAEVLEAWYEISEQLLLEQATHENAVAQAIGPFASTQMLQA